MTLQSFRDAYKSICPSIVGLGLRNDPEYVIFGTGFIVHSSGWILTNRHVIEALMSDKGNWLVKGAAAFLFVSPNEKEGFESVVGMIATNIVQAAVAPTDKQTEGNEETRKYRGLEPSEIIPPEPMDVGVCQIDPNHLPPDALPLKQVHIVHSKPVGVGTPVGILGFPQGLSFPYKFDSRSAIQLTPLLQVGIISGILPFSGVSRPDSFVIDMFVNPGSSGSPLFMSNGDVVGVVYATRRSFESLHTVNESGELEECNDKGVFIPTSLGLAIPSARFPNEWLAKT